MTATDVDVPWAEVRSRMLTYVQRRVQDRSTAEDIVQDVFLRVASNPTAWKAVRDPSAYLVHLTKHAVADHYRRPDREVPAAMDDFDHPHEVTGDDSDVQLVAACLVPLMSRLSSRDRQALRLVDVDGASQVVAAKALGLSPSGMKSRVQRARARLRDQLLECCALAVDHKGRPTAFQEPECSPRC